MTHALPYACFLLTVFASCKKGDRVPAYVEVPAVEVSSTSAQGSSTSKVTDAWITLDDKLIGVWELPARLPALAEGSHRIGVTPAIKRNGMFDDRLRYPFYTAWSGEVELLKEGTVIVNPVVGYTDVSNFWIEDFEDPFTQFDLTTDSDTTLIRFVPSAYPELPYADNTTCAGFHLDATHRRARIYTDEDFTAFGGPVFLEMDHRSDVVITVGTMYTYNGVQRSEPLVFVVPTKKDDGEMPWNKIYIDLALVFNTAVSQRDIYIEVSLPDGVSSGEVYLDNIKLLRITP